MLVELEWIFKQDRFCGHWIWWGICDTVTYEYCRNHHLSVASDFLWNINIIIYRLVWTSTTYMKLNVRNWRNIHKAQVTHECSRISFSLCTHTKQKLFFFSLWTQNPRFILWVVSSTFKGKIHKHCVWVVSKQVSFEESW